MSADKMWGGRFRGGLDPWFAHFQASLPVDHVLAFADLETNRAWSRVLAAAGVITRAEATKVRRALDDLDRHWAEHGVPQDPDVEDVHSLVERELVARCGELGKRLHTGRSRNDQVATDLRLYLRDCVHDLLLGLHDVCSALVEKAEAHAAAPMPGYTHLQRAQPITIGHHALAHAEALARDVDRFTDAWHRFEQCPLGSGALAGTTVPVDRDALAEALLFVRGPTRNSLDATASRDHLCELVFACAMTCTHLSRLAEDYVFFASHEARFVTFGDAVSTGSSLMPQKRNPDAMELVRGHTGSVQGALVALLSLLKGLPLAYNRDLQHDKRTTLTAIGLCAECLRAAALAVRHAEFDTARCAAAAASGYQNATDLADLLVAAGVPFRDAHTIVGRAVDRAVELGVELHELPHEEQQRLLPQLDVDLRAALAVPAVLERRAAIGGTAPARVQEEVRRWRGQLAEWAERLADGGPVTDDEEEE